jgi:hypothetical protein
VRDSSELLRLLDLSPAALGAAVDVAFPLLVPRGFVARMRKGDAHDPLLKRSGRIVRSSWRPKDSRPIPCASRGSPPAA